MPARLRLVMQPFKLTEQQDIADLAAVVPPGAVVFVDTMNRAAPTADENSNRDMGEIIEGAKTLQRLTQGLVILVAHTGKDTCKGLRGHSSLLAALDGAIEISREGARQTQQHLEGRVQGLIASYDPFQVDIQLSRLEAAPLPKFNGWPMEQRQQFKSVFIAPKVVRPAAINQLPMTVNTVIDGRIAKTEQVNPGEWSGEPGGWRNMVVMPLPGETTEQTIARAKSLGDEQRQHDKANQPQKVRKPTDHEQADAYLRTPDSADYWDIEGTGQLVPD